MCCDNRFESERGRGRKIKEREKEKSKLTRVYGWEVGTCVCIVKYFYMRGNVMREGERKREKAICTRKKREREWRPGEDGTL